MLQPTLVSTATGAQGGGPSELIQEILSGHTRDARSDDLLDTIGYGMAANSVVDPHLMRQGPLTTHAPVRGLVSIREVWDAYITDEPDRQVTTERGYLAGATERGYLAGATGTLRVSGGSGTGASAAGRVEVTPPGVVTGAHVISSRIGISSPSTLSNTITFASTPATPTLTMSKEGFEAMKSLASVYQSVSQTPRLVYLPDGSDSIKDKATGLELRSPGGVAAAAYIPRRLSLLAEVLDSVTLGKDDLADPKKSAEFFRSIAAKYAELAAEVAEEESAALVKDVQPGTMAGTSQMDLF